MENETDMEMEYRLFTYGEDAKAPADTEDPESEILGEENDLPTTWQVQLHLTQGPQPQDTEYLTDTETPDQAYTQDTLDTGITVTPEQRTVGDYAAAD